MKRILCLLLLLSLLPVCLPASAEDAGLLVKNYRQLVSAVNEQQANRILISAKYRHGTDEVINLKLDGRTVTVLPEKGESAVINGRVDIVGPGTVIFQNVSITGPEGNAGLWVGEGADVTIGSVKGGKVKKETNGYPAAIVIDSSLTIGSATGGDGKNGFGGDGIYAFGSSTVTVGDAAGGSASKGFGGSGAVVFGGAKITVTGSAAGGNGLYAAGKGVLAGLNSTVGGAGTLTDGTVLEGKKSLDPEAVTSRVTLEHAFRSGRNEILLSPGFRAGAGWLEDLCIFCASEAPVRIANAAEESPATVDCQLFFHCGTWRLDDIRFSLKGREWISCLWAEGSADVTATGSMSVKGEACGIFASGNGRVKYTGSCATDCYAAYARGSASVVFNGDISETGKGHFAAGSESDASVTVNGNITVSNDSNALVCYGGKLTMTGTVQTKKTRNYPAVYASGGETVVNGPLNCEGQATAIYNKGGSVTVNGDVTDMTKKKYPVELARTAGQVIINGTLTAAHTAITADGGTAIVNGDLIIISKDNYALTSYDSENGAVVTINGEGKVVAP